ncbi:HTH-type transcriptional activator RhaS [compost metagenome]
MLFILSLLQIVSSKNEALNSRVFGGGRPLRISEKIMEWMEDHYKEEFSLESLGNDLHLSSYHLSHVFTEETGTSITAYKNARRLREACHLLCTSDYAIREIAEKSGFTDISYFSQLFKKQIGISPKEYRLSSAEQFV